MSHKTAAEGSLTYSEAIAKNKHHYCNLVKDMSWLNSRGHDHTDRDGNVVGYWVDVSIVLDEEGPIPWLFAAAPNTWKMRNAFRKFHFARNEMFKSAGVTKREMGKYGRTIRPFLDQGMVDYDDKADPIENNTLVPVGCTDAARSWDYSQLGSSPGWTVSETGTGSLSVVDEFKLTICGENYTEATATGGITTKFSTAGMIHSYNIDRMEVVTPLSSEVIQGPNNPLAAIRSQSVTSGLVTDIAEDQELEGTPYDISDAGDSTQIVILDYMNTNNSTLQVVRIRNLFIPAGILIVSQGSDGTVTPVIFVDVKGWSLCKDLE